MDTIKSQDFVTPEENIIYEDEYLQVILALDPISIGHVVIVPKGHYKDLDELPSMLIERIMHCAQVYVSLLKMNTNPRGYSIMQNGGDFNDTGQFHLHVFPRNSLKEFSWTYSDSMDEGSINYAQQANRLRPLFNSLLQREE